MVKDNSSPKDEKSLVVRRGRVASVDLYEVKEHELELLEKGSSATLQFNFAIFLWSIAFTCIIALATCTFKWEIVESIFTFTSVIGVLGGLYLTISWRRTRTSIAGVVSTIKNRINEEPIQNPEKPETQPKNPEDNEAPYG